MCALRRNKSTPAPLFQTVRRRLSSAGASAGEVVWSPLAIERAYEAVVHIAGDKPEAGLRWLDGLFERSELAV